MASLNLSAPIYSQFANNDNFNTYGSLAVTAANNAGIDPNVFVSLIGSESSFDPNAVNGQATGIAQFIPTTAAENGINPFDPVSSLTGAANYLATLKDQYGNYQDAIAAYKGSVNSDVAQSQASKVLSDAGMGTDSSSSSVQSASFLDWLNQTGQGIMDGSNGVVPKVGKPGAPDSTTGYDSRSVNTGANNKDWWTNIVSWFGSHAYMAIFIVIGIVAIVFSVRNAFTPAKAA